MELLIGHLKLDVLILFSDIVDERVDWRLCRGLRQVVGGEVDVEAIRVRIEPVLKFLQTQDVGAVLVLGVRSAHLHNSVLLTRCDGDDSVNVIEEIIIQSSSSIQ